MADSIPSVTVIEPGSGWPRLNLPELWRYRELFWFLAARDVKIRYKQTVLGIAWAVLQPLLTMVVFNVLFSLLMGAGGRPTVEGIPYAVSTFAALVPWQLFAQSLERAGNSLVSNQSLVTKVYFPRLVIPGSAVLGSCVDFLLAFGVLILLMLGYDLWSDAWPLTGREGTYDYDVAFGWPLLTLPLFALLAVATSLAVGLWLSALNALYRDFRYVIPFMTQLWFFMTPVVYTTDSIMGGQPAWVRFVYGLNPMAGVAEGFRWALLGRGDPPGMVLVASTSAVLLVMVGGLFYFRRMERIFADWV